MAAAVAKSTGPLVDILDGVRDADSAQAVSGPLRDAIEQYRSASQSWKLFAAAAPSNEVMQISIAIDQDPAHEKSRQLPAAIKQVYLDPACPGIRAELDELIQSLLDAGGTGDRVRLQK